MFDKTIPDTLGPAENQFFEDDIPKYVARKHGEEPIVYAHPLVKDILEPTYGVMVYQEQVMQIAQVMAGYSLGQADLLRRAMGKKIKSEMAMQKERFIKFL